MKSRRMWGGWIVAGAVGGLGSMLFGCPASVPDVCSDGCGDGSSGDGSGDGAPACDPSKDPSCVTDSSGIFVSGSNGSDSNAGTKEAPLKTIGAAVTKASGSKNNVFICAGTYAEHVKLTSAVNLVGGFACADWSYAATNKPKVAPTDAGYALDIESVSSAINISDLEFDAIDGKNAGDSSIAVFANSSSVTFTRDTLSAGVGVAGANGTLTALTFPNQSTLNGNNSDGGAGGAAQTIDCPGDAGTTVGGKGGDNGFSGDPGQPALDGGAGGSTNVCAGPGTGGSGASGVDSQNGTGAATSGKISSDGWSPSAGAAGGVGGPGQGGGGGFGSAGFGGGGGGSGGCGGAGGGGGGGGGGSIALLENGASIALMSSSLATKSAGGGGAGVGGQSGQSPGGLHGTSAGACNGGNGGNGGAGGAGGGGAGGVSVGILYKGTAPSVDGATQNAISVASSGGAKGAGGVSGTNDGIDGVAQATLEIK